MVRVKSGNLERNRHKKWLSKAKGFSGRSKNVFKVGHSRVTKALQYAYRSRKLLKREMRSLWISKLKGGITNLSDDLNYSTFVNHNRKHKILLNRKIMTELLVSEPETFKTLIKMNS